MGQDWYQDIVDFHKEVMQDSFPTKPYLPKSRYVRLRYSLIKEEMEETLEAINEGSLEGIADGIADSIVVLLGAAVTYGIDIRPIWDEVHRSNMAKRGGRLREDGKMLKSEGWEPPRIKELLDKQKEGRRQNDTTKNALG